MTKPSVPHIGQRLDLRQSQQLVMTPQLQQAIKLLQLNNIELTEFIEEELEQNPLLEKVEGGGEEPVSEPVPKEETRDNIQEEFDDSITGDSVADAMQDFDPGS